MSRHWLVVVLGAQVLGAVLFPSRFVCDAADQLQCYRWMPDPIEVASSDVKLHARRSCTSYIAFVQSSRGSSSAVKRSD